MYEHLKFSHSYCTLDKKKEYKTVLFMLSCTKCNSQVSTIKSYAIKLKTDLIDSDFEVQIYLMGILHKKCREKFCLRVDEPPTLGEEAYNTSTTIEMPTPSLDEDSEDPPKGAMSLGDIKSEKDLNVAFDFCINCFIDNNTIEIKHTVSCNECASMEKFIRSYDKTEFMCDPTIVKDKSEVMTKLLNKCIQKDCMRATNIYIKKIEDGHNKEEKLLVVTEKEEEEEAPLVTTEEEKEPEVVVNEDTNPTSNPLEDIIKNRIAIAMTTYPNEFLQYSVELACLHCWSNDSAQGYTLEMAFIKAISELERGCEYKCCRAPKLKSYGIDRLLSFFRSQSTTTTLGQLRLKKMSKSKKISK